MEYIIGIEAGGTKSELAAYDAEYNKIYETSGGFGNPSVDTNAAINNISSLIETCMKYLEKHRCELIVVGAAGADTGNFKEALHDHIKSVFSAENVILNDAEMTAKAYLKDKDGIIAIAGTGASVYVQKKGTGRVIGGWGHILGDRGSGYHTVVEAFKRLTWQIDNALELDNLSLRLLKEIHASVNCGKSSASTSEANATIPGTIKKFIYENPKKTVAALFPAIVRLSEEGDSASIKLLENAGRYLAEMVIIALKEFDVNKETEIGLKGGVFYNSETVLASFKKEVARNAVNCRFIDKDIPVTEAACGIFKTGR